MRARIASKGGVPSNNDWLVLLGGGGYAQNLVWNRRQNHNCVARSTLFREFVKLFEAEVELPDQIDLAAKLVI